MKHIILMIIISVCTTQSLSMHSDSSHIPPKPTFHSMDKNSDSGNSCPSSSEAMAGCCSFALFIGTPCCLHYHDSIPGQEYITPFVFGINICVAAVYTAKEGYATYQEMHDLKEFKKRKQP